MDRGGFRNRMKQYKLAREENPGLKYYDFMERLAKFKAEQWDEDEDVVLMDLLNANDYNYRLMYEDDPNYKINSGHFDDEYKTVWHPTFSEESRYSGKRSEYNPEGVVGGSWDVENKYFYLNDRRLSKQKVQDYLNYNDPGYKAIPKYDEGTDGIRDNTYVAPIEKELVFIPATGALKFKQDLLNKITRNGQIKSGALDIVSPEFDLALSLVGTPMWLREKNMSNLARQLVSKTNNKVLTRPSVKSTVYYSPDKLIDDDTYVVTNDLAKELSAMYRRNKSKETESVLHLLGKNNTESTLKRNLNAQERDFFRKHNVDESVLTDADIKKLKELRLQSISKTLEKNLRVVTTPLKSEDGTLVLRKNTENGPSVIGLVNYGGDPYSYMKHLSREVKLVDDVDLTNDLVIGWIEGSLSEKGVSKDLYNGLAHWLNQTSPGSGFVSGLKLMSPEATTKVLNKLNKTLISNLGEYLWATGATFNNPVYRITKPTGEYPAVKSLLFDPKIIKNGKIITDINNPNIYFAEGGEVTGPPTYELWYAEMNQYNPTILDDASLYWSLEAAKKDLHKQAMGLPGYAPMWHEYVRSLPKADPDINQFVDDLWTNENPNNAGYRNGKYYPHKSPEGGKMTIGPGFKLDSGSHGISTKTANRGMTKTRLDQEARKIGKQHLKAVDQFINYGQTTNPADTVSPQIKMGLMDLRHLVGPLNEWGNLRQAVLEGDLDRIRKESTVTWNDNGKTKVDKRRKKIRDEKYFHYAEGGQVEPDPLDVLEASRPKVAGIPINDKPLSGTDPIGEAMMWGLGGGAASAALRSLFPTYGATAAWLAFGGNNKDNMLVIPNNPTKNTTPIETGLLNKEVRQYYADDVLPRDILTSETDKLKFLNTDKNFEYDLYPQGYFANGVVGHYDRMNDVIRLNSGYVTDKDLLDNVMSHEVNHRYNREFPLDKEHTRILNRAYTVEPKLNTAAARAARKESEKRATNVNIRHKLQTDLRNTLGRKPTKTEMDKFIDSLSDLELLDRLGSASSYGSAYLMSIKERSDLVNQPADQYQKARTTGLRKALKYVAMNENKNDNNQNYA